MSEINEKKSGYLTLRLKKEESLLLETINGIIEIRVRDGEKRNIVSRLSIRAPKTVKIDSILQTRPPVHVVRV